MTRRTASERHRDIATVEEWPPTGEALAEAITALAHPGRRRLLDELSAGGPASVGRLARVTGMAAGSASHHLKVLGRAGFIVPAPELAGDTRESWWRSVARPLQWGSTTFQPGSAGEQLTELASRANLDYLLSAVRRWRNAPGGTGWDGTVGDVVVNATAAECTDLGQRLAGVMREWAAECRENSTQDDSPRRPVRGVAIVFPDGAPHA